ncbi:MAG: beta-ketoacyl-[acyl-carrier-protein] synthase family protein, partial [Bacteroidales bacterium]|nr:beta-ketoacyl-[acyl-carrier-protein] synthase family protein [Bacteroidales bacterium]
MGGAIAITGMGILCAIGNDRKAVLDALLKKESGIGPMRYLRSIHTDIPVGEIKLSTEQMKQMLGLEGDGPVSRTSVMGALAVREALQQAGIRDVSQKRVALISGTTVGVMDVTEQYFERMKTEPELQYLPHSNECGRSTEEIAQYSGLGNARCCTICTACSSALNAMMLGAEMLKNDEVDLVVAGGSEPLSRYHLNGFNTLMILDRERCRPFDETRAGLNLGEGAAFVVLEKDAPNAQAYISGYANRCDAFHQTATSQDGEGAFLAMTEALRKAGLKPGDIQYINAHGTGTPDNDASESAAFKRVFGDHLPDMSSTKSYSGHTTSAAGSVEAVICLLAMQNDFIPASLGWSHPIPGGVIPTQGRTGVQLDYVMCNSFGFGGNDSCLILSRACPAAEERTLAEASRIRVEARSVVSSDEQLPALKEYLSPMDTRRMGKILKASLLSAFTALKDAGLQKPDAIIAATSRGMFELSTLFLEDISNNQETLLKPTLFMQSTHNTVASAIAIRTGCHGYNITYSQGDESSYWAVADAKRLLRQGEAKHVLVCAFDEELQDGRTSAFQAETTL